MHKLHSGYTVSASVDTLSVQEVNRRLEDLNDEEGKFYRYCKHSASTLFISGVLLPEENYRNKTLPATLVLAVTYCGPFQQHVDDFIRPAKDGLGYLFRLCDNFPKGPDISFQQLLDFIRGNRQTTVFNSNFHGISKCDVRKEKYLRARLEKYIDQLQSNPSTRNLTALQIKHELEAEVVRWGGPFKWTRHHEPRHLVEILALNRQYIIPGTLAFSLVIGSLAGKKSFFRVIAFACFLVAFIAVLLLISYYLSTKKHPVAPRIPDSRLRSIEATQLNPILNEMTAAGPLKPERIRRYFFRFMLHAVGLVFAPLIKIPTVSTIRWTLVNNSKRLVFLSNYANTTDFYVRDFLVGKSPQGINFMFSHGQGFPTSDFLFRKGITAYPEGYMNAVHNGQQVTRLWYAHDKNITADIIKKNHAIRTGLFQPMTETEATAWLHLF